MRNRYLVIGDGVSLAHVGRALIAAGRLRDSGAEVAFATTPEFFKLAKDEGFEPYEIFCMPREKSLRAIRRGTNELDVPMVQQYIQSDLQAIARCKPDHVVGDMRLSLNISAPLAGVPYTNIVNAYMTHHFAGADLPPRTFPGLAQLGRRASRPIYPLIKRTMLRYYASAFRRLRNRYGLPPIRDIFDVISSPHGNWIADDPIFMPCANLPEHFAYIGPLIWEPPVEPPEWIDRLDPERPTVYVTMGSTGNKEHFLRILAELNRAGYQVMTTTGGQLDQIPDGVYAVKYARGSTLLKRSDAMVCHGGSATIYQALYAGVPPIAIPTFHDQERNADQLERLGIGAHLHPRRWNNEDLLLALDQVTASSFRNRLTDHTNRIRQWVNAPLPGVGADEPMPPGGMVGACDAETPAHAPPRRRVGVNKKAGPKARLANS